MKKRIFAATGAIPCDTVIRNVRIFHLTTGEFETGDIGIAGDTIVGIAPAGKYLADTEIDGAGLTAVPGFIDAHVHLESSKLRFYEFERCVLPRGTTTAFCDVHELANVAGTAAFDYALQCIQNMKMSLRLHLASCVPATPFETSGSAISAADIETYAKKPGACGLAEVMNVPAVLSGDDEILKKIVACSGGTIDGHAPYLTGLDLNGYLTAGITNDHESSEIVEAKEKLRRGMNVLIREGTVARNLDALMPIITQENSMSIGFCTDDRTPMDILLSGHIDNMVRRSLAAGCSPLAVYRASSWATARNFGFDGYGLIAPGYKADIVLLEDFQTCKIHGVIKHGQLVSDALFASRPQEPSVEHFRNSIKCQFVTAEHFKKDIRPGTKVHVIGIRDLSLITDDIQMEYPFGQADDVAKIAVLERYGKNGNIGVGFVKNSGICNGAIASSVGHDSHNICVVGSDDGQMAMAVNQLIKQQGGFVVVANSQIVETLELPIAGLMSDLSAEKVASKLTDMSNAAPLTGCRLTAPFLQLAFLPLPVIPFLKITDKGVIDTTTMQFVN